MALRFQAERVQDRLRMTSHSIWVAIRNIRLAILATALVLPIAASCGGKMDDLTPTEALGRPIYKVESHFDDDATLTIVDLSQEFDRKPAFTDNEKSTDAWVVVAACASSGSIDSSDLVQLAVIPDDIYADAGLDPDDLHVFANSVDCTF